MDTYLEHATWVRKLAAELVRDPGAADDLVQETWLAFLRAKPDSSRPMRPWLGRVLRNAAAMRRRKESNLEAREQVYAKPEAEDSAMALVARAEEQRRLAGMVLHLDDPYRSCLLLRYFEGLTPTQIAKLRNVPVATVRTHLHRGMERLRQELDVQHGGDRKAWVLMLQPLAMRAEPAALALKAIPIVLAMATLGVVGWLAYPYLVADGPGQTSGETSASAAAEFSTDAELKGPTGMAIRGDGESEPILTTEGSRRIQLLSSFDGQPAANYVVLAAGDTLESDSEGWLFAPAGLSSVTPIGQPGLAVASLRQHAARDSQPHNYGRIALPGSQAPQTLTVPAGPTFQFQLEGDRGAWGAELTLELFEKRQGPQSDGTRDAAGEVHPDRRKPSYLAPLHRADDLSRREARLGAIDRAVFSDAGWVADIRDEAGFWRGTASSETVLQSTQSDVGVLMHATGVVRGPLLTAAADSRLWQEVVLKSRTGGPSYMAQSDGLGGYRISHVMPGSYVLWLKSSVHVPWSQRINVVGGAERLQPIDSAPLQLAGDVSGRVLSQSGNYSGQLLIFLLNEQGMVLGTYPTTWVAGEDETHHAVFSFKDVPVGDLYIRGVSLAGTAIFDGDVLAFRAPQQDMQLIIRDTVPHSNWQVLVEDARTHEPLHAFEFEVQLLEGMRYAYHGKPIPTDEKVDIGGRAAGALEGNPLRWTLWAGLMRWNKFDHHAPLRELPNDAMFTWTLRAEGYRSKRGTQADFDVLGEARRSQTVLLESK